MKKSSFFLVYLIWGLAFPLFAQNTVGVLTYDLQRTFEGYNLFYPHNQPNVYLINNCGQIVHVWEDDPMYQPGNMVYLLQNGNIVKCKRDSQPVSDPIWAGGGGDIVEIRDWDNNLIWSFSQNDSLRRLHHDIEPMPNGNILMISWEFKSATEAIEAGRDPNNLPDGKLWPDYILEVDPDTDEIVWEWHVWDHLVQDFDPTKENYGTIENHPELVNINYTTVDNGKADWMHTNAIDYHPDLDQILISVPTFNEVWIIDHSTTAAEAAGHTGGLAGRGGDLLYRWGNPAAYRAGTEEDQKLFYPHDIHWIRDFLEIGHPYYNKIGVFNNRATAEYSTVNIFNPSFDLTQWNYPADNAPWGPVDFDLTITHPQPSRLLSGGLSSMQVLPNNNVLICSGRRGYAFELTPENEIVWEYLVPLSGGQPVSQGDSIGAAGAFVFRFKRYPADYPAFEGRNLSSQGYLELNPETEFCDQLSSAEAQILPTDQLKIFPNPATDRIIFWFEGVKTVPIHIYDFMGRSMVQFHLNAQSEKVIDISTWNSGIYWVAMGNKNFGKILIIK